ncbi:Salicylate 1-monooxygenase [Actinobacteria bacterium OK074]|nr:Salicylate 1-monooxygenase [Actinobacteria bacterium OK074]
MRIAVMGAGIAGLALGLALERAGLEYRLYEQAPELREVGAGLQLAPNATRLLHRFGLGAALKATAVRPEALELLRWDDGKPLGRTVFGDECVQLFGEPYYTVHRADLQHAMADALPDGRIRFGAQCVGVREHADGVEIRFADGSSQRADIVVGADGLHSVVRGALDADRPRPMGRTVFRGLVPAERVPLLSGPPKMLMWMGPGHHFLCYPVSAGRLVNFSASAPADGWLAESWLAQGSVQDLARAYTGWHEEVLRVIRSADRVSRWALYERDPQWGRGRITLVGDAGHASLPFLAQGANQAVEDSVVLAACLREASSDNLEPALRRYETCRQERVAEIGAIVRGRNVTIHLPDGEQQRRRDAGLTNLMELRGNAWLYGYDADQALSTV